MYTVENILSALIRQEYKQRSDTHTLMMIPGSSKLCIKKPFIGRCTINPLKTKTDCFI